MKIDKLPEEFKSLLSENSKALAYLATIMQDGSPQVTPVWFDVEEGLIRVNTARGRTKDRNMLARPNVAIVIQDPETPYRYVQFRGKVVRSSEEGGREHINKLSAKYTGNTVYAWNSDVARVIFYIEPTSVSWMD